jgi:alkanesulfonate monooxygenase SsuD/methylene tetrahydromethanopterin reductase-like flavin-dependent oxidoreductase (luciferase family)
MPARLAWGPNDAARQVSSDVQAACSTGSPEQVAQILKVYSDHGVAHLFFLNVAPLAGEEDLRPKLMEAIKALATS